VVNASTADAGGGSSETGLLASERRTA